MGKRSNKILTALFLGMLAIPLLTTNLRSEVSVSENRKKQSLPILWTKQTGFNADFTEDFEAWINDNIGLREQLVSLDGKIQYYLFGKLPSNTDMLLGPGGALNYATDEIIKSYRHDNLFSEEQLQEVVDAHQCIANYLKDQGIQYYFFQCWDKQSIYPEDFPRTVVQHGTVSRIDQLTQALEQTQDVPVLSPKKLLIENKDKHATYGYWADATHWTQRGAYLAYRMLMDRINQDCNGKYLVLQEADYDITWEDQGKTFLGNVHREDVLENFAIAQPKAKLTDEEPLFLSEWANQSRKIYRNDQVDNQDTLLIIGDSYFDNYLYDDLAESFHRAVMVWGNYIQNLPELLDTYHPDIVIYEMAERAETTWAAKKCAQSIQKLSG